MMTRRKTLKLALGSMAAASGIPAEAAAPNVASRIIDTHTHFFDPTRPQGVPWPGKGSPLDRPVYPKDWAAVAGKHGIRETVVVEASPWLEDNDWVLNLAAKETSIVGFVGHLMPGETDFAKELKRLAGNPIFRGIRVGGDTLRDNIGTPEFIAGAQLLADLDLVLDVNGMSDLTPVATLAEKLSKLRIVINHVGNAGDAQKLRPAWKDGIAAVAKHPNVTCKVSALVEFNGPAYGKAPTDTAYYLPVLDHVWQSFGADRLMFASNWPVSDKGASYDALFRIVSDYFTPKGSEVCEKFFWKNSLAAYKWIDRK